MNGLTNCIALTPTRVEGLGRACAEQQQGNAVPGLHGAKGNWGTKQPFYYGNKMIKKIIFNYD